MLFSFSYLFPIYLLPQVEAAYVRIILIEIDRSQLTNKKLSNEREQRVATLDRESLHIDRTLISFVYDDKGQDQAHWVGAA